MAQLRNEQGVEKIVDLILEMGGLPKVHSAKIA
jgi:hypothetical protein